MDTLKTALAWIQQLETLPAGALTILVCIAIGYILKFVPEFPNARIPLVNLIFAGFYYSFTVPYTPANPLIVPEGTPIAARLRNFGIGLVLGAVAWIIHAQVLKRVEDSNLLASILPGVSALFDQARTVPSATTYPEQKP